jgi:predicted metal-dependent hydrolase
MSTDRLTPSAVQITFRRMEFGLDKQVRQHWFDGNPILTHFFNALSAMFPQGEKFFIDSVRHYEADIQDPALRAEIRAFVWQEGHHTHQHRLLNERIRARGIQLSRCDPWIGVQPRLNDPPRLRLACTCALEHFTALMSDWLLTHPEVVDRMDPELAALWRWHAIEEIEHKAVAFDTYQQSGGDYATRIRAMIMVLYNFLPRVHIMLAILLRADSVRVRWSQLGVAARLLYGRGGFILSMLPGVVRYFRRDFHPWQHDNSRLIAEWQARGAHGVVAESARV